MRDFQLADIMNTNLMSRLKQFLMYCFRYLDSKMLRMSSNRPRMTKTAFSLVFLITKFQAFVTGNDDMCKRLIRSRASEVVEGW